MTPEQQKQNFVQQNVLVFQRDPFLFSLSFLSSLLREEWEWFLLVELERLDEERCSS